MDFYMPVVTTHRAGDGITRVSVDGRVSEYYSVQKRGDWYYVRMHEAGDDYVGYSCGYPTQREALADCVDRIIRERAVDPAGIA